jgi:hypothetical protein
LGGIVGSGPKWASLLLLLVVIQIVGLEAAGDGDMTDEVQRGLRQQKMTSRYVHLGRVERSSSASEKWCRRCHFSHANLCKRDGNESSR